MSADAWLRRRGRRRATFDPSPVEPTEPPQRPLVTQGARSSMSPERPVTFDDLLRRRGRGEPRWNRIV